MKIVSVGEITIDHYLRQRQRYVGGISLNFAVNAKRSGADTVSLISCVGDGAEGQTVLDTLQREGVDHAHVYVMPGDTAVYELEVTDSAEGIVPAGGYRANVLRQLVLDQRNAAFIMAHDILVTMYGQFMPEVLLDQLLLPAKRIKRVVDFGDCKNGRHDMFSAELFDQIELAFITGDEQAIAALRPFVERSRCQFVVTLGAAGSVALTPEKRFEQAAIGVDRPVDTNGCGDAFQAAFTVSYFQDGDLQTALRRGALRAAEVITHYGSFSQEGWAY